MKGVVKSEMFVFLLLLFLVCFLVGQKERIVKKVRVFSGHNNRQEFVGSKLSEMIGAWWFILSFRSIFLFFLMFGYIFWKF